MNFSLLSLNMSGDLSNASQDILQIFYIINILAALFGSWVLLSCNLPTPICTYCFRKRPSWPLLLIFFCVRPSILQIPHSYVSWFTLLFCFSLFSKEACASQEVCFGTTSTFVILHSHVIDSFTRHNFFVENHVFSEFSGFPSSSVVSERSKAILVLSSWSINDYFFSQSLGKLLFIPGVLKCC